MPLSTHFFSFGILNSANNLTPTLTGPIDLDGTTGEGMFTVDMACRVYWMLSANGTTPDAAAIAAGTGAIEGTGAVKAAGFFDATLGSVAVDIAFPEGINATGAVFSVVARVEPSGGWSNILRDTSVDVVTSPLSATYLTNASTTSPNLGSLAAGWYLVIVNVRGGSAAASINSVTPPGQTAITSKLAERVPTGATGAKWTAAFLVNLTAPRSGAWNIGVTNSSSVSTAIYSLSAEPQLVGSAGNSFNNSAATYNLQIAVQAGDVLIATLNGHTNPLIAESTTDDVTQDATAFIVSGHTVRYSSGIAPATGTRTIMSDTSANFTFTAGLAIALRRAV